MSSFLGGFLLAAALAVGTTIWMSPGAPPVTHELPKPREGQREPDWCVEVGIDLDAVNQNGRSLCAIAFEYEVRK